MHRRTRRRRARGGGHQLFNNAPSGTPRVKGTGYGTKARALRTLRLVRNKPRALQRQIVTTMYHRAKYHKYQTQGMRNAMRVYKPVLNRFRRQSAGGSTTKLGLGTTAQDWIVRAIPAYPERWEARAFPLLADSSEFLEDLKMQT